MLMPLALAAGWFLWAATNGIGWAYKSPATLPYIVRWEGLNAGAGFAVSLLLFLAYERAQRRLSFRWFVLTAVLLCLASAALWRLLAEVTMWQLGMFKSYQFSLTGLLVRSCSADAIVMGSFSLLYFSIDHWRQLAEQREKARQATALAQQAQLQMLRYQLNPHFLFNALNSIRAMIVEDRDRSRQMVTELADFLRYSLDGDEQESTIGDEIQAIENYLAIQRIRFEELLEATVKVDREALEVSVPCFLIHPLVENAVKYGMQTSAMPLVVEIEVTRRGDELNIEVSNSGRLVTSAAGQVPDGTGTGLKNIAERLKLVFPGRHTFQVSERGGRVRAEIRLALAARGGEG
jgi:two-component system LytT family sensor kinase